MADNVAGSGTRTENDLSRAVRSISRYFETDTVFIIGSQSILLDHPGAPAILRTSGKIDAYSGNFKAWEATHPDELASEEINALFGSGSYFHQAYGFYVDGVDENTAKFPPGWKERASVKTVQDGENKIKVIAPCLEDLIVSKLHRLDPKDKEFIRACQRIQPLNVALINTRLEESGAAPDITANAQGFLATL